MIHLHKHPRQCSLIILRGTLTLQLKMEHGTLKSARPDTDDLSQRGSNNINLKL